MQENLVTRNGSVEKELERMRLLLVRVAGKINQLPEVDTDNRPGLKDLDAVEREKVRSLLSGLSE